MEKILNFRRGMNGSQRDSMRYSRSDAVDFVQEKRRVRNRYRHNNVPYRGDHFFHIRFCSLVQILQFIFSNTLKTLGQHHRVQLILRRVTVDIRIMDTAIIIMTQRILDQDHAHQVQLNIIRMIIKVRTIFSTKVLEI